MVENAEVSPRSLIYIYINIAYQSYATPPLNRGAYKGRILLGTQLYILTKERFDQIRNMECMTLKSVTTTINVFLKLHQIL